MKDLKAKVSYSPETGKFHWLVTRGRAKAGVEVGWIGTDGRRIMGFANIETTAARFAWFYVHGVWPDDEIEHINGDCSDCRIANLKIREVFTGKLLTHARLLEVFSYCPNSGVFTRKMRRGAMAAGTESGSIQQTGHDGYERVVVGVDGHHYKAHQLAWFYVHGVWPPTDIDHKDTNPLNNRIDNLRLATDSQNLGNSKKPCTNTSGRKGVFWHKGARKWQAGIKVDGTHIYLGLFDDLEVAHAAYLAKAIEMRGEFARGE